MRINAGIIVMIAYKQTKNNFSKLDICAAMQLVPSAQKKHFVVRHLSCKQMSLLPYKQP